MESVYVQLERISGRVEEFAQKIDQKKNIKSKYKNENKNKKILGFANFAIHLARDQPPVSIV